ncbi:N-acetyltransferase [Agromyces protaetiae]|uniref:N-acetyltransferase n=1 Tax=Agromyces protaetiae TaxID=2509455 RepID=A0A4P6FI82_9MICO|nr:GNAT family protein [Agromyces protaetiae]QAY73677.1 N-acetyltransferase [Agromyces protaetiae]
MSTASPPAPILRTPITTRRLVIRPGTCRDAGATWAYRRLETVNEWLGGTPATFEEYRDLFTEPDRLADTVIVELDDRHGGGVIGDFMVRGADAWAQQDVAELARRSQVELGWVLDPAHEGRGYATEAVQALIRYCFDELAIRRIVATSFLDNERSWRLMERAGMRRELHAVGDALHRSGRWLDSVGYAILREESGQGAADNEQAPAE